MKAYTMTEEEFAPAPTVEIIDGTICIDLGCLDRDSAIEAMKHIGREARPASLVEILWEDLVIEIDPYDRKAADSALRALVMALQDVGFSHSAVEHLRWPEEVEALVSEY